jgi:hypothetical protein
MRTLVGGCRCGHIRYEITEQPWFGFACHCTDCQQLTASAFSLGITVPESGFRLVQNRPQQWTKIGSSGRPSHQFTCPNCSGWTHTKPEVLTGGLVVRPMTLDDHHGFRPVARASPEALFLGRALVRHSPSKPILRIFRCLSKHSKLSLRHRGCAIMH